MGLLPKIEYFLSSLSFSGGAINQVNVHLFVVRAHAGEPHLLFQLFARNFPGRCTDFVQTYVARKTLNIMALNS